MSSQPLVGSRILVDVEHGRGTPWVNTALRTKTRTAPEVLAHALTGGMLTARELRDALTETGEVPYRARRVSSRTAATLGTIWAAAGTGTQDALAGQRLLRHVVEQEPRVLPSSQQQIFAQVSFLLGETADVEHALTSLPRLNPMVARFLRTDLLNPTLAGPELRQEWLEHVAGPFTADGVTAVTVLPGADTLFDGLSAAAPPPVDGPLVSVIVPCYRPDSGLLTSVRSILGQSHGNLEVLLVDDASGPEFEELFQQATDLDGRVRLLRMERNGGTYRGRNAAMRAASGTYITVQDADDWSHPSRIAAQVRALEQTPQAGGSRSDAVRATDDLLHQWIGYPPRRPNASSLMFRRSDVERVGPFDLVRKSGDSEFHERLTRVVGPVVDTRTPLAVTRLRAGTLSRADFSYQWMSPDRLLYRAAYRSWHRTVTASGPTPAVGLEQRPFPAPRAMLRDLPGGTASGHADVDVLLLLDGSRPGPVRDAVALAEALPARRVGAVHLEDPTLGRYDRPEPEETLLHSAREGLLELFSPADTVRGRVAVVLSPGVLEMLHSPLPGVHAGEVVVAARPPAEPSEVNDLMGVADGAVELFGHRPRWAAASAADQATWAVDGWQLPLVTELLDAASVPDDAAPGQLAGAGHRRAGDAPGTG